uniref:Ion_trans_2 domain-containing protein n=1 Tax=Heterorhabditis bacteriophora TaxID=37862 RepID=A0A1I7X522_HETBA
MPPPDLPPRFQLAFRRTVFFAMCLGIWLVIGALIFTGINILNLGETIVRSENDWSEMANQKLELYEKALLSHLGYYRDKKDDSFMKSLRSSYLLITTTGPLVIDNFTTVGKIFAIAYALIGLLNEEHFIDNLQFGNIIYIYIYIYIPSHHFLTQYSPYFYNSQLLARKITSFKEEGEEEEEESDY